MGDRAQITTLFGEAPQARRRRASAFAVSLSLHAAGASLLLAAMQSAPRVVEGEFRFPVETLSLNLTAQVVHPGKKAGIGRVGGTGSGKAGERAIGQVTQRDGAKGDTADGAKTGDAARVAAVQQPERTREIPARTGEGDGSEAPRDGGGEAARNDAAAAPVAKPAITPSDAVESADSSVAETAVPAELAEQTLVEPDAPPKPVLLQPTPLPQVVLWKPETMPVSVIVPPPAHEAVAAMVKPSLSAPNHEKELADERVSSSLVPAPETLIEAARTSPIVAREEETEPQIPETSQPQHQPPTPAAVISITPVRLVEGTVELPTANQTAVSGPAAQPRAAPAAARLVEANLTVAPVSGADAGSSGGGREADAAKAAAANRVGIAGSAAEAATSTTATAGLGASGGSLPSVYSGSSVPSGSSLSSESMAGNGKLAGGAGASQPGMASTDHITQPKDGQFRAVVIGDSIQDVYPETQGMWADRMAYTVYLHVGLKKNWILQYALPAGAAQGGASRPEAPWPWDITRPRLAGDDMNADALLVHGFVNANGRFEQLSVAFPPEFARAQLVVAALQQWQFRPAKQNGQPVVVEVLLIMPSEQ